MGAYKRLLQILQKAESKDDDLDKKFDKISDEIESY